jgi:hypothetical protein
LCRGFFHCVHETLMAAVALLQRKQLRAAAAKLATFSPTVPENETPEPVQGVLSKNSGDDITPLRGSRS